MKEIQLTTGHVAIIDDADLELISQYRWGPIQSGANTYAYSHGEKRVAMHRLILGVQGRVIIDHKNGNTLDNRRDNIRLATYAQNRHNSRKHELRGSKYKGPHLAADGRWNSSIGVNQKKVYLGRYATEFEAALAYDLAARVEFGAFAALNFPEFTNYESLLSVSSKARNSQFTIFDYFERLRGAA